MKGQRGRKRKDEEEGNEGTKRKEIKGQRVWKRRKAKKGNGKARSILN